MITTSLDLFSVFVSIKTCSYWICYERVQFQNINMKNYNCCDSRSSNNTEFSHFTCCFWEDGKEMCNTKNYNANVQPLFCSSNVLFGDVLISVAVLFCIRSLLIFSEQKNKGQNDETPLRTGKYFEWIIKQLKLSRSKFYFSFRAEQLAKNNYELELIMQSALFFLSFLFLARWSHFFA